MSRPAPALQQLVDEVQGLRKSAKPKFGDPDGIGVVREVEFDSATSKWLAPRLEAVADDRIILNDTNVVVVVPDSRADFAQPFGLDEADEVLAEE